MSEKAVHIALYPSDWLAGTRGLTPAETGIYITLVCMMYERQGPLPFDHARLARMCNCPAGTFRKILAVLLDERKLIETPDGLWQRRVEREIASAKGAIETASERGRKAVSARWQKAKQQSDECENAKVKPQSVEQQSDSSTSKKDNEINGENLRENYPSNTNQNQNQNIGSGGSSARARDPDPPSPDPTFRERILAAIGVDARTGLTGHGGAVLGTRHDMDLTERWKSELGLDPEIIVAVVSETMATKPDGQPPNSFKYFNRAMRREAARREEPRLTPEETHGRKSPPRHSREAAADDAFAERVSFVARNRSPSRADFGFG